MTEIFTSIMTFLKELVRRGAMHLSSQIERLDTAICSALVSLLMMFAPII